MTADQLLKAELASLVDAALNLAEPRQAQAFCLYYWRLPPEHVAALAVRGRLEVLNGIHPSTLREVAQEMGIRHQSVVDLLRRARTNIAAWLLAPNTGSH